MEHWSERLKAAIAELGTTSADLARRANVNADSIRKYVSGAVAAPRGDIMARLADALGVELLWLRDGIPPRRPGDLAQAHPGESGDDIVHRRLVAERIVGARKRRGIPTPEEAALGTIINSQRWRRIESGQVTPTLLEMKAIAERLHESNDWLIGGHLTPIDSSDPVGAERARLHMMERQGDDDRLRRATRRDRPPQPVPDRSGTPPARK